MVNFIYQTAAELHEEGHPPANDRPAKAKQLLKHEAVSNEPSSTGLVSRVHENAIFLHRLAPHAWGMASVFGLLQLAGALMLLWPMGLFGSDVSAVLREGEYGFLVVALLMLAFLSYAFVAFVCNAIRTFRLDLFSPKDLPLVLNRKSRKVYSFSVNVPGFAVGWQSMKAVFQPWPLVIVEYDWDCLEAEYVETHMLVGNVAKTTHALQLYVRERPDSDVVIGSFVIGSPLLMGRKTVHDLWEHIRRYMEANGPALSLGDEPAPEMPQGFWKAMGLWGRWMWLFMIAGASWAAYMLFKHGWTSLELMGLHVSATVFTLTLLTSFFFLSSLFNGLAHAIGRRVELPPELLKDAGERLDMKRLATQAPAAVA